MFTRLHRRSLIASFVHKHTNNSRLDNYHVTEATVKTIVITNSNTNSITIVLFEPNGYFFTYCAIVPENSYFFLIY